MYFETKLIKNGVFDNLETKVERTYEPLANPPSTLKGKLSVIGPGIVVAAIFLLTLYESYEMVERRITN